MIPRCTLIALILNYGCPVVWFAMVVFIVVAEGLRIFNRLT